MLLWFRQAKIVDKIHNEKAVLLLDTGAEVSIVDTAFARKVGCYIDSSQIQDCVGTGDNVYRTIGRTRIKVTLAGSLVYFFDIWVGDRSGQEASQGMDFMVPAGIRLDLTHGSISLPDEARIQLRGRRLLYSDKARIVNLGQYLRIQPGGLAELPLRLRTSDHEKFWVTRGNHWVPTIVHGPGKIRYMRITNVGDKVTCGSGSEILHQDLRIGIWLAGDNVPRLPGFISVGSRRYMEWQNLALEATVGPRSADSDPDAEDPPRLAVERPEYETPRGMLQRPWPTAIECLKGGSSGDQGDSDHQPVNNPPSRSTVQAVQDPKVATLKGDGSHPSSLMGVESGTSHKLGDPLDKKDATSMSQKRDEDPAAVLEGQPNTSDQDYDECVYYHEGSDLYAEDVDGQLAVLPEVPATTEDVRIEDSQLCGSDNQTPEKIDRLRQRIWNFQHLLIGKENALPPAARGVVCDIDVGGARPIALKCRKLRIQFREKLAELIKGLLSAKMINHSRSPWASPIVAIIKKNGVDIRLCIDYRLSLTADFYPMPLINDLLEDLESTLWYCSLDMVSRFWVVKMTGRARLISAFITPFGIFEWNRMP
ncbi:LOW QUALITY PROTEIN: hypothetical protein PHMEG_00014226 [Phytophthora megakarya]|uniref:Peptidase A2 domain-containing protein n=1 Tax=Phytophthora megakarya TaxID=4795 RepID=A0A225W4H2_9STRA|nr:LOW QUALITY PROTEIN: hypothetical protein PHMEG_00014226 [Phytophthora megakarya]